MLNVNLSTSYDRLCWEAFIKECAWSLCVCLCTFIFLMSTQLFLCHTNHDSFAQHHVWQARLERVMQLQEQQLAQEQWQANRLELADWLFHISSAIPPGVYLSNIQRQQSQVTFSGYAQQQNQLDFFMAQMKSEHVCTQVAVQQIQQDETEAPFTHVFKVHCLWSQ